MQLTFCGLAQCRIDKLNFNREPVLRHYAKPLLGAVLLIISNKMEKLELKIGDKVELWNGSKGEVTILNFPNITILNKNTYSQVFHRMNIKYVNGILVDGRDVVF